MSPDEARERVARARVARLATLRADGTPHLVPFCFALDGDHLLSAVDHKPKRTQDLQRLANVRTDGRATVLVDEYDDERWERLWWVRLEGTAETLPPDDLAAPRAVQLLAAKYRQYRDRPPQGQILRLRIRRWATWAAADAR